MILLHQLWNQRRQNLWIFIELLIAGFFLWMVIDPIYVLTANRLIPQGGDSRGVYVLQLGQYDESFGQYDPTQDSAQVMLRHYQNIIRAVRACPEVEAVTISAYSSFPNGMAWNGMQLYNEDSVMVHVQQYRFVPLEGSDLPLTYGMRDVRTGERISLPADFATRDKLAISERTALELFGTTDVVGRMVYETADRRYPHEVAAVFRNYKHFGSEQPYPLVVRAKPNLMLNAYLSMMFQVIFRLKDGVDPDAFEARFQEEVAPHLSQGNFFYDGMQTFAEYGRRQALSSGITNKLRLQYSQCPPGRDWHPPLDGGLRGTHHAAVPRGGRGAGDGGLRPGPARGGELRVSGRVCRGHQRHRPSHEEPRARPGLRTEPPRATLPLGDGADLRCPAAHRAGRDLDTRPKGGADVARGGVARRVNALCQGSL